MNSSKFPFLLILFVSTFQSQYGQKWNPTLDLVIVIDTALQTEDGGENGTSTTTPISDVADFCRNLSQMFSKIGTGGTQLGLITFDSDTEIDLHWTDSSESSFFAALTEIDGHLSKTNKSNVIKPLQQYESDMKYDGPGSNFMIVILRGDVVEGNEDETSNAFGPSTMLIVVDGRTNVSKSNQPIGNIFGNRTSAVYNGVNRAVMEQINKQMVKMECDIQIHHGICYYTDDKRGRCVKKSHRPAAKYEDKGKICNISITVVPTLSDTCPIDVCEETCDMKRPWEAKECLPFECGQKKIRKRKLAANGSDPRLEYCLDQNDTYCEPCAVVQLGKGTIRAIIAVRFTIFLLFLAAAVLLTALQLLRNPNKRKGGLKGTPNGPKANTRTGVGTKAQSLKQ